MNDFDCQLVRYQDLPEVWPQVRHWIKDALEYTGGRESEKTVLDALLVGLKQLWIVVNGEGVCKAAFITEILKHPTGLKTCSIYALGGQGHRDWVWLTEKVGIWSKQFDCTKLQLVGREGWIKALKGWGKRMVMIETPIGD